ncbi:MAG TPA: hypothetical protein VGM37_13035 [Armatimonadota bacterium]|jgi:hypothetical protein
MEDTEYEYDMKRSGRKGGSVESPAQARLRRDTSLYPVDWTEPVPAKEPNGLGMYGDDIVDAGLASDASVGGLGADLDAMPGDETPISRHGG